MINSLKAAVDELNLSGDEKETLIYGLYLIVWLPKLILEQAISMFNFESIYCLRTLKAQLQADAPSSFE